MDLGFHLAMSYRDLKHPTSRKNFAAVVGQNHALILTQCHMYLTKALPVPPVSHNNAPYQFLFANLALLQASTTE